MKRLAVAGLPKPSRETASDEHHPGRTRRRSRENGRMLRGPKTLEGKHRARSNALKHGLRADVLPIPGEDPTIAAARGDAWHSYYQPQSPAAHHLANECACAHLASGPPRSVPGGRRRAPTQPSTLGLPHSSIQRRRAPRRRLRDHPADVHAQLFATAAGCRWLIERWEQLKTRAQGPRLLEKPRGRRSRPFAGRHERARRCVDASPMRRHSWRFATRHHLATPVPTRSSTCLAEQHLQSRQVTQQTQSPRMARKLDRPRTGTAPRGRIPPSRNLRSPRVKRSSSACLYFRRLEHRALAFAPSNRSAIRSIAPFVRWWRPSRVMPTIRSTSHPDDSPNEPSNSPDTPPESDATPCPPTTPDIERGPVDLASNAPKTPDCPPSSPRTWNNPTPAAKLSVEQGDGMDIPACAVAVQSSDFPKGMDVALRDPVSAVVQHGGGHAGARRGDHGGVGGDDQHVADDQAGSPHVGRRHDGCFQSAAGGESMFRTTFTAESGPGEVTLAPSVLGDIMAVRADRQSVLRPTGQLSGRRPRPDDQRPR